MSFPSNFTVFNMKCCRIHEGFAKDSWMCNIVFQVSEAILFSCMKSRMIHERFARIHECVIWGFSSVQSEFLLISVKSYMIRERFGKGSQMCNWGCMGFFECPKHFYCVWYEVQWDSRRFAKDSWHADSIILWINYLIPYNTRIRSVRKLKSCKQITYVCNNVVICLIQFEDWLCGIAMWCGSSCDLQQSRVTWDRWRWNTS